MTRDLRTKPRVTGAESNGFLCRTPGSSSTGGFALPLAILALTVLSLLMAGALALAIQEVHVARARVASLQARVAAESAVRAAIADWPGSSLQEAATGEIVPAASGRLPGGAEYESVVEKLQPRLYLVRGKGGVPARPGLPPAVSSLGALITTLDAAQVAGAFPGAVAAMGRVRLEGGATITGDVGGTAYDDRRTDASSPTATIVPTEPCGWKPWATVVVADAALVDIGAGAIVAGLPDVLVDSDEWPARASEGLASLASSALTRIADHVVRGSVQLRSAVNDAGCDTDDSRNWGAPLDPASPCASHFPIVYAPDGLDLRGGAGQGVLIANGDLTIRGETAFYGPVLVRGNVLLESGASIHGGLSAISPNATVRVRDAAVRYDPCAIAAALRSSSLGGRPFLAGPRPWLPLF